jgi:hypothetical protein
MFWFHLQRENVSLFYWWKYWLSDCRERRDRRSICVEGASYQPISPSHFLFDYLIFQRVIQKWCEKSIEEMQEIEEKDWEWRIEWVSVWKKRERGVLFGAESNETFAIEIYSERMTRRNEDISVQQLMYLNLLIEHSL